VCVPSTKQTTTSGDEKSGRAAASLLGVVVVGYDFQINVFQIWKSNFLKMLFKLFEFLETIITNHQKTEKTRKRFPHCHHALA
jgi:hypothetical protein